MTRTPLLISKVKGQGHQTAVLSLTSKASAAVSVGTYWAWETTASLNAPAYYGWGHNKRFFCRFLKILPDAAMRFGDFSDEFPLTYTLPTSSKLRRNVSSSMAPAEPDSYTQEHVMTKVHEHHPDSTPLQRTYHHAELKKPRSNYWHF